MTDIYTNILMFFAYCFLGYFVEVIYCSIGERHFVNRGFLHGPWLPIYGFGGMFIHIFLIRFKSYGILGGIAIFLLSGISTSIIEYIGSVALERLFSIKLWDYSTYKYNINGRVCLKNSTFFALMGLAVVYLIGPKISELIYSIPILYVRIASIILLALFSIDFILSTMKMASFKKALLELYDKAKSLSSMVEDDYEEIVDIIHKSFKRIISSFPGATSSYDEFKKAIELLRRKNKEPMVRNKKHKG